VRAGPIEQSASVDVELASAAPMGAAKPIPRNYAKQPCMPGFFDEMLEVREIKQVAAHA
jgi:hypothetical protein